LIADFEVTAAEWAAVTIFNLILAIA